MAQLHSLFAGRLATIWAGALALDRAETRLRGGCAPHLVPRSGRRSMLVSAVVWEARRAA